MIHCPKCFVQFVCQRDLENHLNRKTPCDVGDFQCTGCNLRFTTKRGLNAHNENKRCKGKSAALVAHEASQKLEEMEKRLAQQEELLCMTNSVTAAAASNPSSSTVIGTQHNHITINIQNNVSSLGEERISHFSRMSDEEMLTKLSLTKSPAALANWCALLRADEDHPENHNALLLSADSKEMACCRKGRWAWEATEKLLLEISRTDMMRLYTHLGRYDQNPAAQEFRHEFLLHDMMTKSNSNQVAELNPVMEAIAKPIIALTQKFYSTTVQEDMDPEEVQLTKDFDSMKEALVESRASFEKAEAKLLSTLLSVQRRLSEKARQKKQRAEEASLCDRVQEHPAPLVGPSSSSLSEKSST